MNEAHVADNAPAGTHLRHLTLDVTLEGYDRPGQFIQATLGELKPAFFAIASPPGKPVELLLKTDGATAKAIGLLQPGDALQISDVMGKGFAIEQSVGRELVILCNGSGISACRPVIEAEIAKGLQRPVHFYYGVLTPPHRSFLWDLERWANAGVKVHTVVGEPDGTGWRGRTGFVQQAAEADGLCRDDVSVVMVGLPIMIDQAKAMWSAAGCPDDQLLLNF